ncbi:thioredoxin fold domain-containing protein [Litoribrevibacter albus]|uniref:Thioredoxin-like fold domain-containing protein n=1 Tax=Litoribrevibacter albus TaxID=1473156 RepID=A0AA37S6Y1_9GAMM|nr:thioredoxin fold domain-containing protein [Litoribrevibacter albus]GLQ30247.1 hypothetical protein GCM10007876_07250 [Litoribrevibacter albus]
MRYRFLASWVCLLWHCLGGQIAFAEGAVTVETFKALPSIRENDIQITEYQEVEGLYLVNGLRLNQRGKMVPVSFSVSSDLRYTFLGKVIDNQSGKGVYVRKPLTTYTDQASFSQGDGSEAYYIFTDIECAWCTKLEAELIKRSLPETVSLHYFLYPLQQTESGIDKSYFVLAQNRSQRLDVMRRIMLNKDKEYQHKTFEESERRTFDSQNAQVTEIAKELSVRGTPTIFDKEGNRYTYKQLLAMLWKDTPENDKTSNSNTFNSKTLNSKERSVAEK